ncbi:hypothetical protein SAY86_016574 [Trapa natans]|uniref:Uncharacterized protein n=1 Tax=Trapa natans TaxID=22666 RepID=A0AAN7L9R8_TRANT|nr:hypothetical protein SAY86_016574 [Trapa natans]
MTRGKIQIKPIENWTNRQVTYSKRRNGLFKKARELAVLCDAKVSLIMISCNNRLHEYTSPTTTTKEMIDEYQKTLGVDVWSSHYEAMEEELTKLKELNSDLRLQINRRRLGEGLDSLGMGELCGLEHEIGEALQVIRERKMKVLTSEIDKTNKKRRNAELINRRLIQHMESISIDGGAGEDEPHHGLVYNCDIIDPNCLLGYPGRLDSHPEFAIRFNCSPATANLCSGGDISDITAHHLLDQ